jgi:hypothetical protein
MAMTGKLLYRVVTVDDAEERVGKDLVRVRPLVLVDLHKLGFRVHGLRV